MTGDTAFVDPPPVVRNANRAPPLGLWLVAAGIVAALAALTAAWFIFVETPVATPSDAQFYRAQIERLDRQVRHYRQKGEEPISVVFIGTSRMKNVAFDPAQVTRAARSAGVRRPVANTYMAVNWGGFERFGPAVEMLRDYRPDVIVVMPEFFVEDFNYLARARLGYRYLQTKLWGQDHKLFGTREFNEPVCHGFEESVDDRLEDHGEWIMEGDDLPGPDIAEQAVRDLASNGSLVVIADVPVSRAMAAHRSRASAAEVTAESAFAPSLRVRSVPLEQPLGDAAYCDWAHINPARADVWRQAFFARMSRQLNRMRP